MLKFKYMFKGMISILLLVTVSLGVLVTTSHSENKKAYACTDTITCQQEENQAKEIATKRGRVVAANNPDFVLPTDFAAQTCFTECYSGHNGVDIPGYYTNITAYAFYDMIVLSTSNNGSWNTGYGNHVKVAFQYRGVWYTSIYAHLSFVNVVAGQRLAKGQVIGTVGTTGNSTGIHLHLEIHEAVMRNGVPTFEYTRVGDPRLRDPRRFLGLPYSWNNLY